MSEAWRPIVGYETLYEVSDQGQVRRVDTGKIRKLRVHMGGYLFVDIGKGRRYENGAYRKDYFKRFFVHRLVAEAFIGPIPGGYEGNHLDGNKKHNAANNLEIVTPSENHRHAVAMGLAYRGSLNGAAILDEQKVREIRRRYAAGGVMQKALAAEYGVSVACIQTVTRRERWAHV